MFLRNVAIYKSTWRYNSEDHIDATIDTTDVRIIFMNTEGNFLKKRVLNVTTEFYIVALFPDFLSTVRH
jgi:hypothetical protein